MNTMNAMKLGAIRDLIRKGQLSEAQHLLGRLPVRRLAREVRLEAAYLAREAGAPGRVIEILFPVVRPGPRTKPVEATPEEKGEYAMALLHLGLDGEAKALLKGVEAGRHPRAAEALAFALFRDWDFGQAAVVAGEALSATKKLRDSERFELQLDQSLARLHARAGRFETGVDFSDVRKSFRTLIDEAGPQGFSLLRRFAHFGLAITSLFERDWPACELALDHVDRLVAEAGVTQVLPIVPMWRTLAALGRAIDSGAPTSETQSKLLTFKQRFLEVGFSNYARSCDYNTALLLKDAGLLSRMYFSVPQSWLRARIEEQLVAWGQPLAATHDRELGPAGEERASIDLWSHDGAAALGLKLGQLPHRILVALASDAYARPSAVQLFGLAFPDEYFRRSGSTAKINDGLARLRGALRTRRSRLRVEQRDGLYFLDASAPVALRIHRDEQVSPFERGIRAAFGDQSFSSAQFGAAIGLKGRTARQALKQACDEKWLARSGVGRATRYRLA